MERCYFLCVVAKEGSPPSNMCASSSLWCWLLHRCRFLLIHCYGERASCPLIPLRIRVLLRHQLEPLGLRSGATHSLFLRISRVHDSDTSKERLVWKRKAKGIGKAPRQHYSHCFAATISRSGVGNSIRSGNSINFSQGSEKKMPHLFVIELFPLFAAHIKFSENKPSSGTPALTNTHTLLTPHPPSPRTLGMQLSIR
jgi:hypothetical protein